MWSDGDLPAHEVLHLAVAELTLGYSPRASGVNRAHVQALVELGGAWPPVLVHHPNMVVIDGAHRLAAAQILGFDAIAARAFTGTEQEARIEAIESNNRHGLPLTLPDRKRAASHLIAENPDWSDGRLAKICSLSPKTIAALRRTSAACCDAAGAREAGHRLGSDNRRHPVDRTVTRARVLEALERFPGSSLRVVAAQAGVSPETVRTVRRTLTTNALSTQGLTTDQPSAPRPVTQLLPTIDHDLFGPEIEAKLWRDDRAVVSTPEGARFAAWFDEHTIDEAALWEHPGAVPIGRLYEVIDEARKRSRFWSEFATQLEVRICNGRS